MILPIILASFFICSLQGSHSPSSPRLAIILTMGSSFSIAPSNKSLSSSSSSPSDAKSSNCDGFMPACRFHRWARPQCWGCMGTIVSDSDFGPAHTLSFVLALSFLCRPADILSSFRQIKYVPFSTPICRQHQVSNGAASTLACIQQSRLRRAWSDDSAHFMCGPVHTGPTGESYLASFL